LTFEAMGDDRVQDGQIDREQDRQKGNDPDEYPPAVLPEPGGPA
jgi:hypothetical protein